MPVIIDPTSDAVWLESGADAASFYALLVQYPADRMEAFSVNPWVSNPKHEGPRCLETLAP
jgi:putative SOS response-associated peptidase YedK